MRPHHLLPVLSLIVSLPLLIVGGGSCGTDTATGVLNGTIDGHVYVSGPVAGVTVSAFVLDLATGEPTGDALASSEPTGLDGAFHLDLGGGYGPLLLVARGAGSYTEPASAVTVTWNGNTELRSVFVRRDATTQGLSFEFERGAGSNVVLGVFSDLALAWAEARTGGTRTFSEALEEAYGTFEFHLDSEFWTIVPSALTEGVAGGWNDAVQAGVEAAGLSALALRMAEESSITPAGLTSLQLLGILRQDLANAVLDGQGEFGNLLTLGSCSTVCPLSGKTLRAHFAEAVAGFLGSARNTSGIGVTDAQVLLDAIACRGQAGDLPLFPPITGACSFDSAPPTIAVEGLEEGQAYTGDVQATVTLFDAVEMGDVALSFVRGGTAITDPDFADVGVASPNKQTRIYTLAIHTAALTDGPVTLHVEATDAAGHQLTPPLDLTFIADNSPLGHVAGVVVAGGRVSGARVTIHEVPDGVKGDALGSAITDANGSYIIEVAPTTETVLLIDVDNPTGGTAAYIEPANGATIDLSTTDHLTSLITGWYDGGERIDGTVTPWTDVAAVYARARYLVGAGPLTTWSNEVEEAFTVVEEHFADGGPAIDLRAVIPADLTSTIGTTTLTSQVRYGVLVAALSELADQHAAASTATPASMNSLTLTSKLGLDLGASFTGDEIAIPLFDGYAGIAGMGGLISHGSVAIDSYTTRLELAVAAGAFLASADNATAFRDADVGALLDQISMDNNLTSELYPAGEPGGPYDVISPVVAFVSPSPAESAVVRGAIDVRVDATDNYHLASLVWTAPAGIAGDLLVAGPPMGTWSRFGTVNTDAYPEGNLAVTAVATDTADRATAVTRTVVVDRTNPAVIIASATTPGGPIVEGAWTGSSSLTLYGTATDAHFTVAFVSVNGGTASPVTVDAAGNWSVTVALAGGTNTVALTALDAAGNAGADSATFYRDATPPTIGLVAASFRDDTTTSVTLTPASGPATAVVYGAGLSAVLTTGSSFTRFASDYGPFSPALPEWRFDVADNHSADASVLLEARLLRSGVVLVDWTAVLPVAGVGYDRSQPLHSSVHVDLARVSGAYTLEYRASDEAGNTSSVSTVSWTQTLRPPPVRQRVETGTCAASEASCPSFYNLDNSLNNTQLAIKGGAGLPDGKLWIAAGFVDNPTPVPVRLTFAPSATSQWRKGSTYGHPRVSDPSAIVTGCLEGVADQLPDGTCYTPGNGTEATTTLATGALVTDFEVVNAASGLVISLCAGCTGSEREIPANTTVKVYVRGNPFGFVWAPALTAVTSLGTSPTLSSVTATLGIEWLDCITTFMTPGGELSCSDQVRRQSVQYLTRVQVTPTVTMTIDAKPASSSESFSDWSTTLAGDGTAPGFSYTGFPWNTHETGWSSF